jgi:hypothetical protein
MGNASDDRVAGPRVRSAIHSLSPPAPITRPAGTLTRSRSRVQVPGAIVPCGRPRAQRAVMEAGHCQRTRHCVATARQRRERRAGRLATACRHERAGSADRCFAAAGGAEGWRAPWPAFPWVSLASVRSCRSSRRKKSQAPPPPPASPRDPPPQRPPHRAEPDPAPTGRSLARHRHRLPPGQQARAATCGGSVTRAT